MGGVQAMQLRAVLGKQLLALSHASAGALQACVTVRKAGEIQLSDPGLETELMSMSVVQAMQLRAALGKQLLALSQVSAGILQACTGTLLLLLQRTSHAAAQPLTFPA